MAEESTQDPAASAAGPPAKPEATVAAPARPRATTPAKVSPARRRRRVLVVVLVGLLGVVALAQAGVSWPVIVLLVLVIAAVTGLVVAIRKARRAAAKRRSNREAAAGRGLASMPGRGGTGPRSRLAGLSPGGRQAGRGSAAGRGRGAGAGPGAGKGAAPGKPGRMARLRAALPGGKKNAAAMAGNKPGSGAPGAGRFGRGTGKLGAARSGRGTAGKSGRFGGGVPKASRSGGTGAFGKPGTGRSGAKPGRAGTGMASGNRSAGSSGRGSGVRWPSLAGTASAVRTCGRAAGSMALGAAHVAGWGWRGSKRSGRWTGAKASRVRSWWSKRRAHRTGFIDAEYVTTHTSTSTSSARATKTWWRPDPKPAKAGLTGARYEQVAMAMPSTKPPKASRTFVMPSTTNTTTHFGGTPMSHHATQGTVEAAAQMASYQPKNLLDIVNVSHSAPSMISSLSQAFSNLASGLENTPAAAQADQYRQIAAQLAATASSASETGSMLEAAHKPDLDRIRNPRPGEHMADYTHNQS